MRRLSNLTLAPALAVALLSQAAAPAPAAAGGIQTDGPIVSTVPPGTPPLQVASPDRVENLNADTVDGYDGASFRFQDEIRVGRFGTGEFHSIQEAIDSLNTPLFKNILIHVGPGQYNERVVLPDRVHLRGSGKGLTVIVHDGADTFDAAAGTLVLGDHTRVSDLTVVASEGHRYAVAVYNPVVSAKLDNVHIQIGNRSTPAVFGILNESGGRLEVERSFIWVHSTEPAFTYGIWNRGAVRFRYSRMDVSYEGSNGAGFFNSNSGSGGWAEILHSELVADPAIVNDDGFTTYLTLSRAFGGVASTVHCNGVVVGRKFYANECP